LPHSKDPVQRERALRRILRSSFESWARFVLAAQGHAPAAHHLQIIAALEAVERGEAERLLLLLPPGSAKSTFASLLFPAWWMARHPTSSVICACHTVGLAQRFGRSVRGLLMEHGPRLNLSLRGDARAAAHFLTEQGGEYYGVGVHGAVTGRRADLALIDDPVRSFADAESGGARERVWNWFRSDLLTRLKPGGRTVIVMTRWHRDDIAGRLIAQGGWQVLRLPALAESGDPMGRAEGDALWPAWESRDALLEKQRMMGERSFAALFQQSPVASDGLVFDITQIKASDIVPAGKCARGWDLAAAGVAGRDYDWTVGVKLVRDSHGKYWVDDVRRFRAGPEEVAAAIVATAHQDGTAVAVGLPQDPGQAGRFQAVTLAQRLAGFQVQVSPERGPKTVRAHKIALEVGGGRVILRRAAWNTAFLEELAAFPDGRKDDQVDALARAFGMLSPAEAPARFDLLPQFFGR
jgi:predicted phage terminase large subunit-like protein